MKTNEETQALYQVDAEEREATEDRIISQALDILYTRMERSGDIMNSVNNVKNFLTLQYAAAERELFAVTFLTNQHELISHQVLFKGTIDSASVHPREIIKAALRYNAAAIIINHNHPSGNPEPSQADEIITNKIKDACTLLDIRLLDHFIVGASSITSFAERGLL